MRPTYANPANSISINLTLILLTIFSFFHPHKHIVYSLISFSVIIVFSLLPKSFSLLVSLPSLSLIFYHIINSPTPFTEFKYSLEMLFCIYIIILYFSTYFVYRCKFSFLHYFNPIWSFFLFNFLFLTLQFAPYAERFNPIISLNENAVSLTLGLLLIHYLKGFNSINHFLSSPLSLISKLFSCTSIILLDSRSVFLLLFIYYLSSYYARNKTISLIIFIASLILILCSPLFFDLSSSFWFLISSQALFHLLPLNYLWKSSDTLSSIDFTAVVVGYSLFLLLCNGK